MAPDHDPKGADAPLGLPRPNAWSAPAEPDALLGHRASDRHLAIVKLSALGDIVHALPVAGALRARWPTSRLTWIVERRHAAVLRGHPALDEVVTVDTHAWRRAGQPQALVAAAAAMLDTRRRLRAAAIDTVLDLQGLVKSGLVSRATGAPARVGFARGRERPAALFLTRRVTPPPAARHVVDQYLALAEAVGADRPARVEFPLPVDPAAEAAIDAFFAARHLPPRTRVVVLNPGAGRPGKRWPIDRFAALAGHLARRSRVLVLWGPGEEAGAQAIAGDLPGVVPAPPTDLGGLLAVVRRASVVVAGDTGPLHLAAAAGVPCVGLFGPTSGVRNGPYGDGHTVIQSPDRTMAGISIDVVLGAVGRLLDRPVRDAAVGTGAGR
jgi:heptosyltransferase-1